MTMVDEKFKLEAQKLMMPIHPISGEELSNMVRNVAMTPPDIIQKAAEKLEWKD
jgi:hypothetical protein